MRQYMTITHEKTGGGLDNPLHPENLDDTLNRLAAKGWALVSYDWTTWRRAIFVKEEA